MKNSGGSALLVVLVMTSGILITLLYTWFQLSLLSDISHDRIQYQQKFNHAQQIFTCCQEFICRRFDQLINEASDFDLIITIDIDPPSLQRSAVCLCKKRNSNQLLISVLIDHVECRALIIRTIHPEKISFQVSHTTFEEKE